MIQHNSASHGKLFALVRDEHGNMRQDVAANRPPRHDDATVEPVGRYAYDFLDEGW